MMHKQSTIKYDQIKSIVPGVGENSLQGKYDNNDKKQRLTLYTHTYVYVYIYIGYVQRKEFCLYRTYRTSSVGQNPDFTIYFYSTINFFYRTLAYLKLNFATVLHQEGNDERF